MRTAVRAVAIVFFASLSFAQTQGDPVAILNKVNETYSRASQFEFEGVQERSNLPANGPEQHVTTKLHVYISSDGRLRMDGEEAPPKGGPAQLVSFYVGGEDVWIYVHQLNVYMKAKPSSPIYGAPNQTSQGRQPTFADLQRSFLGRFWNPLRDGETARLLEGKDIEVQGKQVACYVVEVDSATGVRATWYIDK